MDVAAELERAREYHRRQAWADAFDAFEAVDRVAPLAIDDLGRLAESAHILGRCDDAGRLLQRVYQVHADAGDTGAAVRAAFYLWHTLIAKGEFAHAGGWIARARRLAEPEPDCAEVGYLLVPEAERQFGAGEFAGAFATAARMTALGARIGDHDLVAIAAHIQGRARIREGRVVEGLALLDEALVGVTAGETSAGITSWIYCSVIDACRELSELRRAREWTVALNAWCDARPQYTGVFSAVCRIHRAELLLLGGAWPDAVREAQLACEQLTRGYGEVMAGPAFYQLAEAYRLGGDPGAADEAYRNAGRYGGQTQPGLALLWLAQGGVDRSVAAIRRALAETALPLARFRMLPAYVEIMLARYDVAAARAGCGGAGRHRRGVRHARPARPGGVRRRRGRARRREPGGGAAGAARGVATVVRSGCTVRGGLHPRAHRAGLSCPAGRGLGRDGAGRGARHLRSARRRLRPGAYGADDRRVGVPDSGRLSRREREVLRLVAAGKSNQAIAAELTISDRTVERHLSNIFVKLGVASRTAAAAYAFAHGIH